jgi:hypothetical protein
MSEEKFVDPRLQAKEAVFELLHLSTYDTMTYAHAIIEEVNKSGHDISASNEHYQQLLRDYEVTRAMAAIEDSPLQTFCQQTNEAIQANRHANASVAQLTAAATNTLNHWRILCEIPEDLREVNAVTKQLKQNYENHLNAWKHILDELI